MLPDAHPLPHEARQQYRREDDAHQLARNEHNAEGDHHKAYQQQRGVDMEGTLNLVAADAQQQRDEDYRQQPQILHQQAAGHDDEVLIGVVADEAQQQRQGDSRRGPHNVRALLQELARVQPLGHEAEHQQVDSYGHQGVEGDGDKQAQNPVDVPVGPLRVLAGGVLPCHHLLHPAPVFGEVTDDAQVGVAAVDEDARLYVKVALLRIVVHVLQPLLRVVVVAYVVLHLLRVILQGALDDGGQRQAHGAVRPRLLAHLRGVHRREGPHQAVVAGYLAAGLTDELAEGQLLPLEVLVLLRGLVAGVGQVEQILLLLRVEHQRVLVRLPHGLYQVAYHLSVLLLALQLLRAELLVVLGQLRPQDNQGRVEVALLQHSPGLCQYARQQGQYE